MAQPANSFDSYDAKGVREDLLNNIWNLDPSETPFLSGMAKTRADNKLHEWQTDALQAPSAGNAQIEGDDITADAVTPTVPRNNRTQIFRKSATITGTNEALDRAGRDKEMTYQMGMRAKELKTDMEMSIFANNAAAAGSSTVPRELAGAPTWLTSNTSAGTGGADATGDGTDARTDGTQRAFTETLLTGVLSSIWDNSGVQPDCVYLGSFNKKAASGFTGSSTRFDKGEDAKLTAHVDIYEYDFGSVRFEPSRHVRARDAVVVKNDLWAWAELRPMFEKDLAVTGDSEKKAILAEATLVCRSELGNAIVADLTTS